MTEDKKKQLKKIVSAIITLVLLAWMGWLLYTNQEMFASLKHMKYSDILIIILLQPINVGLVALTNKLVIDHIGQNISFSDSFLLQYANNFLNKLVAEGGSVYRGGYLKTQYALPLSKYISSIAGVYIIGLLTNAVMGVFLLLIIYVTEKVFNIYVVVVFLVIMVGTLILIVIEPRLNESNWVFRKINQVLEGWNTIKSNKKLLFHVFILSALGAFTSAVSTFIAYRGLAEEIQFVNSLLYSSISTMANFVNLTPGGLGVNEAVLVFSSEVIGISSGAVLLGALVLRALTLITSFVLGGISYLILNHRLLRTQNG